jgi:clan AA aspartic protease
VITGTVNADREPIIRIVVRDASGQEHEYAAVVDTGFTGWLTLPPDVITVLGPSWREWGAAILADGSQISFNVYDVPVVWDGQLIKIPTDEADAAPLVGMRLMQGYSIFIKDVDGGIVRIERM